MSLHTPVQLVAVMQEEEKAKYVNLLSDPHSGSEGGGNAPITLDANRR